MSKPADLITYVFDGSPPFAQALKGELLRWMDSSTRFTDFVETYRDKIRKKIRVTRDFESILDLRGELDVACGLLADRRFNPAYEPYASAGRRGPDFSVTYRANTVFNIEVARIRAEANEVDENLLARKEERVVRILLDKLGQMQPGMSNLLAIHLRPDLARAIDLARLMQSVKAAVESKDAAFYAHTRYTSPAAFYKDFLLLGGLLFWAPGGPLWINKQARPALDEKILRQVALLPQPLTA